MKRIPSVTPPWWTQTNHLFGVAIIAFVVIVATICYYESVAAVKDKGEKIDFAVKAIFGSGAILALAVSYQTLKFNIYREQVKGTYDFLSRYNADAERKNREKIRTLLKRTGFLDEYKYDTIPQVKVTELVKIIQKENAESKDGETTEKAILSLLSLMEDMALAIRSGYANEATTYRSLGEVAVLYVNALRPYISHIQEDRKNRLYYADALLLAYHWRGKHQFRIYKERNEHLVLNPLSMRFWSVNI